jgi:hypothetical protein
MMTLEEHAKRVIEESKPVIPSGRTFAFRYGRTVNLGNYESCRIELEQSFDETMPNDHALELLARRVEGYAQMRKKNPDLWVPRSQMEVKA